MRSHPRTTPRRNLGAEVTTGAAGAIIRLPDTEAGFLLNPSAFAIWNLCDGATALEEIAAAIAEVTGASADNAMDEVVLVMRQFEEAGLVE